MLCVVLLIVTVLYSCDYTIRFYFDRPIVCCIHAGVRALRPYIELNLVVPQAAVSQKRKFVTSHKSGTTSPNFNQSFKL